MFSHCHRLADMLPSTKELSEDLFGAGVGEAIKTRGRLGMLTSYTICNRIGFVWAGTNGQRWSCNRMIFLRPATPQSEGIAKLVPPNTVTKVLRLASLKKHGGEGLQFKSIWHFEGFNSMFQLTFSGFQRDTSNLRLALWCSNMSGLSQTGKPQVVEYERTNVVPDFEQVKPASQLSDFRSVAALAALRACQGTNFQNFGDQTDWWMPLGVPGETNRQTLHQLWSVWGCQFAMGNVCIWGGRSFLGLTWRTGLVTKC